MTDIEVVERLMSAAFKQGGERLELVSGEAAVLVRRGERLKAGGFRIDADTLVEWWMGVADAEAQLPFELGNPASTTIERAGKPVSIRAQRTGDGVRLELNLGNDPKTVPPVAQRQPKKNRKLTTDAGTRPLDRFLREMVELDASDLHLSATVAPMIRLHGEMHPLSEAVRPLTSDHILMLCDDVAPAANRQEFRERNDTDFAYEIEGVARFRVNLFRDRKGVGAVFRQIPTDILDLETLKVPECVKNLCQLSKGLVLVTGPTGSGKSTTLAAMIDYINAARTDHVITIEDPIEFVHENKRCLINQREVFSHTESFKHALRAALREDPDIVLVGEMRDLETIAIAIETAETGHLVFGTLHTTTAVSTVDRIIDQFPADRQEQIRIMLSDSLKGVIAQTLCRRKEGGRVAAYEILLGVPAVANMIRESKSHQIPSIMQTSRKIGMQTLNDSLALLVRQGIVEENEAILKSVDKDGLRSLLRRPPGG
jgi:twitching motility protein PilT